MQFVKISLAWISVVLFSALLSLFRWTFVRHGNTSVWSAVDVCVLNLSEAELLLQEFHNSNLHNVQFLTVIDESWQLWKKHGEIFGCESKTLALDHNETNVTAAMTRIYTPTNLTEYDMKLHRIRSLMWHCKCQKKPVPAPWIYSKTFLINPWL